MATKTTPSKRYPGTYHYLTARGLKRWGAVVDLGRDWTTKKRVQDRREGMLTQDEAVAWQAERRTDRRTGAARIASDQLLGDYLEGWLAGRVARLRPATRYNYRMILNRMRALFPVPLDRLRTADVEAAEQALLVGGFRPTTVRVTHSVLSSALRDAVRMGLIPSNPCDTVDLPAGGPRKPTTWDADQ
ncbi:site-specific integrase, partial [Iamia sp.]|uniref:site-specific integrase n=1 Tax=Iamia sp. TaxID=2722710 RepID=UPI002CBBFE50